MMTNGNAFDKRTFYEIRVIGVLDQTWADWFDGFTITSQGNETRLQGEVADQAALLGLLSKITNLGLTLVWVKQKMEDER
jgi:hypothetical protein